MLTPQWILNTTDGKLVRGTPSPVEGFSIDSRTTLPKQCFVALRGTQHDGHDHLDEAFSRGASSAVIDQPERARGNKHPNLVLVHNARAALQSMARGYRQLFQVPLVGITGSVGKTTTKELLSLMLKTHLKSYVSPGNFNNEIGLPLSLLNMPFGTQVGVFELGTQRPGELKPLANILGPSISVITTVTDAHLGHFQTEEQLVNEKWALVDALPLAGGIVVLNADHTELWSRATHQRFRVDFGIRRQAATFHATEIEDRGLEGVSFTLVYPQGQLRLETKLLGLHNVYNVLAAAAVATEMRVGPQTIQQAAAQMSPYPHRLQWRRCKLGILLDDCYNASPSAVKAALSTISKIESHHKVFVFGDMLEQGQNSLAVHQQAAHWITDANVQTVFTVGSMAAETGRTLQRQLGWSPTRVKSANTVDELEANLRHTLTANDHLILIKGSRGMALETLVDHLE